MKLFEIKDWENCDSMRIKRINYCISLSILLIGILLNVAITNISSLEAFLEEKNDGYTIDCFDRTDWKWSITDVVSLESTGYSRDPSIAVDSGGNCHIFWNYDDGTSAWNSPGKYLQGRTIPDGGSPNPVEVLDSRNYNVYIADAIAAGGHVFVVYSTVPGPGRGDDLILKIGVINGSDITWRETAYLGQRTEGAYNPIVFLDEIVQVFKVL